MELVRFLLNYYNETPDRAEGVEKPLFPKQVIPQPIVLPPPAATTTVPASTTRTTT
jgi:hypothetical protein